MIAWNNDVLTTAARLCPYSNSSYVTATTEATQVYNYYCSDCPIWSMTERSKFLFRTWLFFVVGRSLAPLRGTYGLLLLLMMHSIPTTPAVLVYCLLLLMVLSIPTVIDIGTGTCSNILCVISIYSKCTCTCTCSLELSSVEVWMYCTTFLFSRDSHSS